MKLFVGYSKAPEQPQTNARPICQSHTITSTGCEPATIRTAAYRRSPRCVFTNTKSDILLQVQKRKAPHTAHPASPPQKKKKKIRLQVLWAVTLVIAYYPANVYW